uniref:DNA polymerase delta subunit 3 n=1 Tax=Xiphophorus couchianus TaxID=32473 RepID=A0A3B5MXW8_9TELE
MDELYLDNIDEYVNDHNKIVTYKWLSLTLGVHVNTAKQMLYHYLEHKRKESSPQLHATYLVSGKLEDKGQMCHKVSVVREDQLEDFKSKMSLIVSVHVYSVQKALLKDSGPLYSVDYDAIKDNLKNCSRYSAIRCARAVPMSAAELQQVQEIQRAPPSAPENKKSAMNGDANIASKPSSKPQKGIMGMFANKSAPKNQDNSKDVKPEPKEESPVVGVFVVGHSCKTKRMEESDSEEEKMEKKKRRRIKKPQPDSSDEDVIPDSPPQMKTSEPSPKKEPETVQHSHMSSGTKIRRRRKVLKSRTFKDEEGCIVTEKDYVSESYSETEDDFQSTKQAPRNNNKAKPTSSSKDDDKKTQKKSSASSNKGSKQASIMGFFQKK